jgi:hypothetical protein
VAIERRKGSTVSKLDDALLVVLGVVAVLAVFTVVGWIMHAVFFLVKVAIAAVVFGLIVRAVASRRR